MKFYFCFLLSRSSLRPFAAGVEKRLSAAGTATKQDAAEIAADAAAAALSPLRHRRRRRSPGPVQESESGGGSGGDNGGTFFVGDAVEPVVGAVHQEHVQPGDAVERRGQEEDDELEEGHHF